MLYYYIFDCVTHILKPKLLTWLNRISIRTVSQSVLDLAQVLLLSNPLRKRWHQCDGQERQINDGNVDTDLLVNP